MEKMAIIYDFDYTLCTKDAPMFELFPSYGLDESFFDKINVDPKTANMEANLCYMYHLNQHAKESGKPLTKQILRDSGKNIEFYPGVIDWFERINEFGKKHGVEVEHYLISSGVSDIVEGCPIANKFKKIFASSYHYDENGFVDWPLSCVNYTNKTQYIYRINRGLLSNKDDDRLNGYFPKEERIIKYENMIYIGDGFSDVPSMKTTIEKGGFSIAVYATNKEKATDLVKYGRCNKACVADYTDGSDLDIIIKEKILSLKNE